MRIHGRSERVLWFENLHMALLAIWANKLRSFLTVLGIVIGVAVTVGVQGILQGITGIAINEIQGLGSNTLFVSPYRPPGKEGEKLGRVELRIEDGEALRRSCPDVDLISPVIQRPGRFKKGEEVANAIIVGSNAVFQDTRNIYVDRGRFFSSVEEQTRARVCVVGTKVVEDLKLTGEPLGQTIALQGQDFTIVGILEEKGKLFGFNFDELSVIPLSTAVAIWGQDTEKEVVLIIRVRSAERVEETMDEITDIMRRRHKLRPSQPNDFQVESQAGVLKAVKKVTDGISMGAAVIVGFALLVATIGVTNIMLVSVTERTREIGIRKAIGAKRQNILLQFLIEAVTLCSLGGAVGILAGLGFSVAGHAILNHLIPGWPPISIPLMVYVLGVLVPAVFGIVAGLWPAYKAARLDPIEALRYE
jgi:putative ABC transport system permease protein